MAQAHTKNHDYHLVDPSPWPALISLAIFILSLGAIYSMHGGTPYSLVPGFLFVLYCAGMWWRDVVREAENGDHTRIVQLHHRYGMLLFIASEVMFFVAWFWAYFDAAWFPNAVEQFARVEATGGVWPPKGIVPFDPWHLPLLNTLILLTSGTTVTWAHHAIVHGDRKNFIRALWITIILGFVFSCLQALEYSHAAFGFSGNVYSAAFYMATGFHGFHVIVGTLFLAVCLGRAYKGHFTPQQHLGFEAAAWYWHFVDVVWLFLFAAIYVGSYY